VRRTRLSAAVLAVAALLLAGCGGDDTPSASSTSTPPGQQVAGGQTIPAYWPLTGLPVDDGDSSAQRHPVMVLKMDNTDSSAPQEGLGSADMVVEELVEGGLTRLAAFYYQDIPGEVGPVRSMRASDIGIVSPVGADVVTSGAAPVTIRRITGAGIKFFGEGTKGFFRASDRPEPYNLMTNLKTVVSTIHQKAERPDDYLPWGDESDLPKGKKATSISAVFGSGHTTEWSYSNGGYVNTNTHAAQGDEFPADTVLVLRVQVGDAGYKDPAGNPVPETKLMGKGKALLFHGGEVVRGGWKKKGLSDAISLFQGKHELKVPAGHTWIELVPAKDGNVTFH
jgi:hypothetical protein